MEVVKFQGITRAVKNGDYKYEEATTKFKPEHEAPPYAGISGLTEFPVTSRIKEGNWFLFH